MSKIVNITLNNIYKYLTENNSISDKDIKLYIFDEFKKSYKSDNEQKIKEIVCSTLAHAISIYTFKKNKIKINEKSIYAYYKENQTNIKKMYKIQYIKKEINFMKSFLKKYQCINLDYIY